MACHKRRALSGHRRTRETSVSSFAVPGRSQFGPDRPERGNSGARPIPHTSSHSAVPVGALILTPRLPMQGFWRRTKPWRPSKTPRERPRNEGPALEWTFKKNMEEIVSVQSIFPDDMDGHVEVWTLPKQARPTATAGRLPETPPAPAPAPAPALASASSSPSVFAPAPAPRVPEKMKLGFLLNTSEPTPKPPPTDVKAPAPKRVCSLDISVYVPAHALKRHRSSV